MIFLHLPETSERFGAMLGLEIDPGAEATADGPARLPAVRLRLYLSDGSGCVLRFDALEAAGLASLMEGCARMVATMRNEALET